MKNELTVLYGDVVGGEVHSPVEFRLRLEAIQLLKRDGDPELDVGGAVRAVSALKHEAPSRHHQFELLREALRIT